MNEQQRQLILRHTRLMVHLLYCYCMIATFPVDAWNRYEIAKDTYLEREHEPLRVVAS